MKNLWKYVVKPFTRIEISEHYGRHYWIWDYPAESNQVLHDWTDGKISLDFLDNNSLGKIKLDKPSFFKRMIRKLWRPHPAAFKIHLDRGNNWMETPDTYLVVATKIRDLWNGNVMPTPNDHRCI